MMSTFMKSEEIPGLVHHRGGRVFIVANYPCSRSWIQCYFVALVSLPLPLPLFKHVVFIAYTLYPHTPWLFLVGLLSYRRARRVFYLPST